MKNNFYHITKRFSEEICEFKWDLKYLIQNNSLIINDTDDSEICYIDMNHELEEVIEKFLKYLKTIHEKIKDKYLVMIIYNFKSFLNIKKISKYFKESFYFTELWGNTKNAIELNSIDEKHISLLPVSSVLNQSIIPKEPLNKLPNKNIFLSLWHNSYDFDLIEDIVKSNPHLNFRIPNKIYVKGCPYHEWKHKEIHFRHPNLNIIKSYTWEYLETINKCDTFIILFSYEKDKNNIEMLWGSRFSNALRWNKYIIINKNYMNEIVMAKDWKTCLLVDQNLNETNAAIQKIFSWKFKIDADTLDKLKYFLDVKKRLRYIYDYILEYNDEKRVSNELNFKFDKQQINFLKKIHKLFYKKHMDIKEEKEHIKINEIFWITKWQKIESIIIYKITSLASPKNTKDFNMYIFDIKNGKKITIKITNKKQKKFFIKTKNWYYILFISQKNINILPERKTFLDTIKNIIEKTN